MSTTRTAVATVAMAALLVLAGCASPISSGTDAPGATGAAPDDGTSVGSSAATIDFYISDEENAIADFEHLNVTITRIGVHRTGSGDDDDGTETETETPTETELNQTPPNATATATPAPGTETGAEEAESEGEDEEERDGEESDGDDDGKSDASWVEYEVDRTVDLTELQGANASKLGSLAAPNGSYDKVFVYVSAINATLENGEQVRVKLPSSKLQIKKGFTIGDGENVSFVFDMTVKKAGKSGKYILQPVISESGTSDEVDIEDVDEEEDEKGKPDDAGEGDDEETEATETEEPTETPEAEDEGEGKANDDGQGNGNNPSLWTPV